MAGVKPLEVLGVRVEMPTNTPIVLLKEVGGRRHLPIWVGAAEASAIAYAQQGVEPPRPLTHDLFVATLEAVGRRIVEVQISALRESYFHATLVLDDGTRVDARASDALALALRAHAPVTTPEELLAEAGVLVDESEAADPDAATGDEAVTDGELARFREFLDHVTPEDFEGDADGPREAP